MTYIKKSGIVTLLLVTICLLVTFMLFYSKDERTEVANASTAMESKEAVVRFSKLYTPEEFKEFTISSNLKVKAIHFKNGEVKGGYTLDSGESVEQALVNLLEEHQKALRTRIEIEKESQLGCVSELCHSFVSALERVSDEGLKVKGARLSESPYLQVLLDKGALKSVTPVLEKPHADHERRVSYHDLPWWGDIFASVAHAYHISYYVPRYTWEPGSGLTRTTQNMAYNSFSFPNTSGFSSGGDVMTYEHETQIYNVDFADYDDYWDTNLPGEYLDTSFYDVDYLENYTIGSSQASLLQPNTSYWTYIALTPGTASTAPVLIKGQIGHREPTWCSSTWCIFPDMTTGRLADYDAPISSQLNWTY